MTERSKLKALERLIGDATGAGPKLDMSIASTLGGIAAGADVPNYTSSVDSCIQLIADHLPHWHWHIGHGPAGIVPYASLRRDTGAGGVKGLRIEASACTVPLALLHAAIKALDIELQDN